MMAECPNCGKDHEPGEGEAWVPNESIERDLAAMVALVLSDEATIRDFALLVGSEERASALLLRAVQIIAAQGILIEQYVNGSEDPRGDVLLAMRAALLERATPKPEGDGNDEGA